MTDPRREENTEKGEAGEGKRRLRGTEGWGDREIKEEA